MQCVYKYMYLNVYNSINSPKTAQCGQITIPIFQLGAVNVFKERRLKEKESEP